MYPPPNTTIKNKNKNYTRNYLKTKAPFSTSVQAEDKMMYIESC
jgi:hypothetical protein